MQFGDVPGYFRILKQGVQHCLIIVVLSINYYRLVMLQDPLFGGLHYISQGLGPGLRFLAFLIIMLSP